MNPTLADITAPRTETREYTIDIDGLIYIEDVPCEFQVRVETYPAEPYSWGASRGDETDISVEMTNLKLGGLTLARGPGVMIFGEDAILRAESVARDRVAEEGRA